jgi:hypothetical protein
MSNPFDWKDIMEQLDILSLILDVKVFDDYYKKTCIENLSMK